MPWILANALNLHWSRGGGRAPRMSGKWPPPGDPPNRQRVFREWPYRWKAVLVYQNTIVRRTEREVLAPLLPRYEP